MHRARSYRSINDLRRNVISSSGKPTKIHEDKSEIVDKEEINEWKKGRGGMTKNKRGNVAWNF